MNRALLPLACFLSCATPAALGADSARNPDAAPPPRADAARVLVPDSPLLDLAVAEGPKPASTQGHPPEAVIDPVCGMKVKPGSAAGGSVTMNGHTHYFCSSTCRTTFVARDGGAP